VSIYVLGSWLITENGKKYINIHNCIKLTTTKSGKQSKMEINVRNQ
jgi:hypothetical protein